MTAIVICDAFAANIDEFHSGGHAVSTPDPDKRFGVTLFKRAPHFADEDTFYSSDSLDPLVEGDPYSVPPRSLSDITNGHPYWQVLGDDPTAVTVPYTVVDFDFDRFVRIAPEGDALGWEITDLHGPAVAMAFWWAGTLGGIENPLVALVRFDGPVLVQSDEDHPCYVVGDESAANRLFGYLAKEGNPPNPKLGDVRIAIPMLEWESARAAHVWMKPQRVNFVANPSFEVASPTVFGWRSNADLSSVTSGGPPVLGLPPRTRYGHLDRSSVEGPMVAESNLFPLTTAHDPLWSLEAAVAGDGQARLGLVSFDPSMVAAWVDWGEWHRVTPDAFTTVKALVTAADTAMEGLLRIEFRGESDCYLDNVLADNNGSQLGYFDGSWHTGQRGDFTWYGGPALAHRSFSIFYNDREFNDRLLFGYREMVPREGPLSALTYRSIPDPAPVLHVEETTSVRVAVDRLKATGEDSLTVTRSGVQVGTLLWEDLTVSARRPGTAEDWVPERAQVIPQWDDVWGYRLPAWPGDVHIPVADYDDPTIVTILEEE